MMSKLSDLLEKLEMKFPDDEDVKAAVAANAAEEAGEPLEDEMAPPADDAALPKLDLEDMPIDAVDNEDMAGLEDEEDEDLMMPPKKTKKPFAKV